MPRRRFAFALAVACLATLPAAGFAQRTQKPPLHGQEWMAVTVKPLGAAAGARVFLKGGNAVDHYLMSANKPETRAVVWMKCFGELSAESEHIHPLAGSFPREWYRCENC